MLEYLSGYIGECHASEEECSVFIEVRPSASRCPRSLATIVFALSVLFSHLMCTSLCLPSVRPLKGFRELLENFVWAVYGGESETTDEKLAQLYSAAAE